MNAIYLNRCHRVVDDDGHNVRLRPLDAKDPRDTVTVPFADPALIIDPTDDEWFAAADAPPDLSRRKPR